MTALGFFFEWFVWNLIFFALITELFILTGYDRKRKGKTRANLAFLLAYFGGFFLFIALGLGGFAAEQVVAYITEAQLQ